MQLFFPIQYKSIDENDLIFSIGHTNKYVTMPKNRTYSTGLKIKYKLGLLPDHIKQQIHRNTRYYWSTHFDLNHVFGIDDFDKNEDNIELIKTIYENQRLKKMVLALSKAYIILSTIIKSLDRQKHLIYQQSGVIIKVIDEFKDYFGTNKLTKLFDISPKRYLTWKYMHNCVHPLKETCKKLNPLQISFSDQEIIKQYLIKEEYKNWGIANIYYQMLEDGNTLMSLQTFRNYINLFFPYRTHKIKKRNKYKGIRANRPFEKLHMDVTLFRMLDNSIAYIYFIVDNFSRKILSYQISTEIKADISLRNLEKVCVEYNLFSSQTELIVDGGSENKGAVNEFILSRKNWKKLVAQKDIIFSNSMVEAVNKIIKYQYLFTRRIADMYDLKNYLPRAIDDYNNRPHSTLKISPNKAANGITFDKELYRKNMQIARKNRIQANIECNRCSME